MKTTLGKLKLESGAVVDILPRLEEIYVSLGKDKITELLSEKCYELSQGNRFSFEDAAILAVQISVLITHHKEINNLMKYELDRWYAELKDQLVQTNDIANLL